MEEKKFLVNGSFAKSAGEKKFSKEVKAGNEKFAVEKTFSLIGSKHNVKRNHIKIIEVKEAK